MKVAVYGTLRKGFGNHRVMEIAGGTFIKKVRMEGIQMFGYCNAFPACVVTDDSHDSILVELYEVSDLRPLDRLEGYTPNSEYNLYERVERVTVDGDECFIYVMNSPHGPLIESGDFADWQGGYRYAC